MLDRQAFIENLIDYFQNPRNRGKLKDADVSVSGGNPGCGDIVTMYVKVKDGVATEVRFEGEGCTISQAGASMVAEKYEGHTLTDIESSDVDDLVDEMGRDVVVSRLRCATVGIGTLKAAVHELKKQALAREREEA
ncbi:MAG: iron-sulfur cluster assembly scaffold protein [Chloroflexota bacterium]